MTDFVMVPVEPSDEILDFDEWYSKQNPRSRKYRQVMTTRRNLYKAMVDKAMLAARPPDELRELIAGYAEAIEDIEAWAAYASDYFKDKHDLEGCLAKHRAILSAIPSARQPEVMDACRIKQTTKPQGVTS